ncbi:hypothetical protein D3C80_1898590 [compost metagenome]
MNGPLLRAPSKCRARAISSLPVPVSPSISTGGSSVVVIRRSASSIWVITFFSPRIAADSPISAWMPEDCASRVW